MLDYAVADIPFSVVLDLDEQAFRHKDLKMTQDLTVVVQVMVERIALVQIAVQEVVALDLHGVVDQLGWLLDDQEEVVHRPIPAE